MKFYLPSYYDRFIILKDYYFLRKKLIYNTIYMTCGNMNCDDVCLNISLKYHNGTQKSFGKYKMKRMNLVENIIYFIFIIVAP